MYRSFKGVNKFKHFGTTLTKKTALSRALKADGTPGMPVTFRSRIFCLPVGLRKHVINIESNIIFHVFSLLVLNVVCHTEKMV